MEGGDRASPCTATKADVAIFTLQNEGAPAVGRCPGASGGNVVKCT